MSGTFRRALSLRAYLDLPGWRASDLRAYRRGPPARVPWERANPPAPTDAMLLGSLVDAMILDPDALGAFEAKPEGMSFATRDGKAWRDDPARAGRIIVPHATWTTAATIAGTVARKLGFTVPRDECQVAVQWGDDAPCKGRIDWLAGEAIYDLKVTRHATPDMGAAAWRMGWMHQLAWYRAGCRATDGVTRAGRIIAVSPDPPHYVHLAEVKPDVLDLLEIENARTVAELERHERNAHWPTTPDTYALIEPPAWAWEMTLHEAEEEA